MKKSQTKIKSALIFKALWQGVRPYKLLFWMCTVFYILGSFFNIIVPLYYKKFFDVLENFSDKVSATESLIHILYIIVVIHGVIWVLFRGATFMASAMQSKVMAKLKQNTFDYVMLHSYNFFSSNFTGSLVQKINRFSRAFERLSDTLYYQVIPLVVTALGAIIVTWIQARFISLIILVWVIFFSLFNWLFSRWKVKYDIASAAADSRTTGFLSDSITNHNTVSLFTGYMFEVLGFKSVTDDQARKQRLTWDLSSIVDSVQVLLIFIVEFAVFYYAVRFWEQGVVTIGTFVLFQVYVIGLAHQLWGLSRIIRNIYESMADSQEMVDILNMPHEIKDVSGAKPIRVVRGEVEFKNVGFSFNKNKAVLRDINLTIKSGEKMALIGPSGAGKTTIVRLILRLYDTSSGSILIDGVNIGEVTQESLRENISLVPQDPVLFHRSLMDNIRYGKRTASDEEVMRVAKLAHCDEFIENLPLKYETFVGERGIKLSGGERQRVAIARAILKDAPILILDEATSSLDSHSEALIQDALDTLMRDRTTVVIAHRLSTIRKMDRIVVIEEGIIREEGTHDDLVKTEGGLYKKLWNLQAGGFII
ncbi:MAG: ABC transporter ATP-binding protein [bacterium]|nr:ABC transporter ATP-binding protein [bacterium]